MRLSCQFSRLTYPKYRSMERQRNVQYSKVCRTMADDAKHCPLSAQCDIFLVLVSGEQEGVKLLTQSLQSIFFGSRASVTCCVGIAASTYRSNMKTFQNTRRRSSSSIQSSDVGRRYGTSNPVCASCSRSSTFNCRYSALLVSQPTRGQALACSPFKSCNID